MAVLPELLGRKGEAQALLTLNLRDGTVYQVAASWFASRAVAESWVTAHGVVHPIHVVRTGQFGGST